MDDPGWRKVLTRRSVLGLFLGLIPGVGTRYDKRTFADPTQNPLLALRAIFLRFVLSVVILGAVVPLVLSGEQGSGGALSAAVGIVMIGFASVAASEWMSRRPLNCSDDEHLAASYRTTFFVRMALAQSITLFGFVLAIAVGVWWLYGVGAAVAAIGFARLAPTSRNLERLQWRLTNAGCGRSLVGALTRTAAPRRTAR